MPDLASTRVAQPAQDESHKSNMNSQLGSNQQELPDPAGPRVAKPAQDENCKSSMNSKLGSNQQEVPDPAGTRAAQPAQDESCKSNMNSKLGSNQQEMPDPAGTKLGSNQQEVPDPAGTRVAQPAQDESCKSNMNSKLGSNQQEVPDPAGARVAQPAQDESCKDNVNNKLEVNPALVANTKVDSKYNQRERSEDTIKQETRANSSDPTNETHDDEIPREVVGKKERNKHDDSENPGDGTRGKTCLKISNLDSHIHPASDIESAGDRNQSVEQETNVDKGSMTTQATKNENCDNPDTKKDSEPGPGSRVSMNNDTDEEAKRSREKEEGEETDKKGLRSDSPESVDDAPGDKDLKGSDEKSAKAESVRYAKVCRDEENKHNAVKGLVKRTRQISDLKEGALGSYMNPVTDMEDSHNDSQDLSPALTTDEVMVPGATYRTEPVGAEDGTTTIKEKDMAPVHGHEDVHGDGDNSNNVTALQNYHCDSCDTTLNDNRSVNHHLKTH